MIHRHLVRMKLYDAYFLFAIAFVSLQFFGEQWLLFPIWILGVTAAFCTIRDMSSWFRVIAEEINFLARCIRDHK